MIKFIKVFQGFFPSFCILMWVLFCSSCVTTTVYYPVHRFVEKEENTVTKETAKGEEKTIKKGIVEFMVLSREVISPPPGVITNYETASERGRKDTYKQIQSFCKVGKDSKYSIKSISTKVRHSGWEGYTSSYYGYYSGFATTTLSPVYRQYTSISFQCD